jgi:phosphohistidine phosphatase SixA
MKTGWIDLLCRAFGLQRADTPPDRDGGGPRRVLLMRHAEKTGDPDDIHLSDAGMMRARRLARYIPDNFGKPDFIFAAARSKHSMRSIETVQPLANALGLEVQDDIEDKDFEELVSELFSNSEYLAKTILICWHHGKLPEIAALLGAPDRSYLDPWPENVFNVIIDLGYGVDSSRPPTAAQVIEPF